MSERPELELVTEPDNVDRHPSASRPGPHDMTRSDPHGHADLVTIATCACGATFDGCDEADVLTQWGRHAEELEE